MILTVWIIVTTSLGLAAYDIYAVSKFGLKGTISWITWTAAQRWPVIPLAVGILLGHLFWRQESPQSTVKLPQISLEAVAK